MESNQAAILSRRSSACAAAVLLLLSGCGEPFSNSLFEEDYLYVEAVPVEDDVLTEHPASHTSQDSSGEDSSREVGDLALFPPKARDVAVEINGSVFWMLAVVDGLLTQPITTRQKDARIWGPYDQVLGSGSARLVVTRSQTTPTQFDYTLSLTPSEPEEVDDQTEWQDLLVGRFDRDSETLSDGNGAFSLDADVLSTFADDFEGGGVMEVDHRRQRGTELWVSFTDWVQEGNLVHSEYYFARELETTGQFARGLLEYAGAIDLVPSVADGLLEDISVLLRWQPGSEGRADYTLVGGSLTAPEVRGSECWDGELKLTYEVIDGISEDGDPSTCVYPTFELPSQITAP